MRIIESIKQQIPIFHTRAMKQQFFNLVGRISPKSKPFLLRSMYQSLTNDKSAARTTAEHEVDGRLIVSLSMEYPDVIVDLRELNKNGYQVFWERYSQFLSECTSVHEQRHGSVVYMAKAISIRDLVQEVTKLCPENTPIPSHSWVQLNFCPRNLHALTAIKYTSSLKEKHVE